MFGIYDTNNNFLCGDFTKEEAIEKIFDSLPSEKDFIIVDETTGEIIIEVNGRTGYMKEA